MKEENSIDVVAIMRLIQNEADQRAEAKRKESRKEVYSKMMTDALTSNDVLKNNEEEEFFHYQTDIADCFSLIGSRAESIRAQGVIGEILPADCSNPIKRFLYRIVRKAVRFITTEQRKAIESELVLVEYLRDNELRLQYQINLLQQGLSRTADFGVYLGSFVEEKLERGKESSSEQSNVNIADDMYRRFEDKYRGSSEDIIKRQQYYLEHFLQSVISGKTNGLVIDLGCGRGEWLELLASYGVQGVGVDLNSEMLTELAVKGIKGIQSDALDYLCSLESESVQLLTCFQLIEHISTTDLIKLAKEIGRVMQSGGIVIIETPNPANVHVGACSFYLDPTHKRPVHPEFLRFLMMENGFSEVQLAYWKQAEIDNWLMSVENRDDTEAKNSTTVRAMLGELQRQLFVSPDYAVVAFK